MATFSEGISETLALLRRKGPLTRAEIVAETGLSRSAVTLRLDALQSAQLVTNGTGEVATKGRPADRFEFNPERGKLLAVDIGVTKFRAGLCDLGGDIEAEVNLDSDVTDAPEVLLEAIERAFDSLLEGSGTSRADILGLGMSLPAPIKHGAGMSVSPPIIPRWNRFDVADWFTERFACPVFLEKDANAMAVGEAREAGPDVEDLMLVKLGTGIGSGMIHHGRLYRGADGAAGDLGHTPVTAMADDQGPLCKCGNHGCLEAYAGGWALVRDLQEAGRDVRTQQDLVDLIQSGDPEALRLVRRAGRLVGSAVASAVNLVNPRVVILGGRIASAGGDQLVAGIREMVYRRSLPLATAELRIERSTLYPRSGLVGLAHLVGDEILSPEQINRLLPEGVAR